MAVYSGRWREIDATGGESKEKRPHKTEETTKTVLNIMMVHVLWEFDT